MRVTADSTKFDSHANAFVMFKYGNLFAIAANPFRNLKFVITFDHNKNGKHNCRTSIWLSLEISTLFCISSRSTNPKPWWKIRICMSCKFQIWPNNFWCLHIYCLTPNLSMNWQNPHLKLIPIFKHYECIANAFVQPSNSAPSAVTDPSS